MVDRDVKIRLRADTSQFNREMLKAAAAARTLRDEINTSNDRTAWLAQGLLALAPAAVPIGASVVPALSAIATTATVGVGAVASLGLAFVGVGDTLGALNDAQLEPTAANMEKLNLAMAKLGPDGESFVRFLDGLEPKLRALQWDARAGMFPGMQAGIESLLDRMPQMRTIVREISAGIGDLASMGGAGLAGPEFDEFFSYLEREARPILVDVGRAFGNFIDGFASMMVAFDPLTQDFTSGLLNMSRSFEQWAEGLQDSQSFADFVDYVQQSGPLVKSFFGDMVDAFLGFVDAAAPVGKVVLPVLGKMLDILGDILETPVGPLLVTAAALTSMVGRMAALRDLTTGGVFKVMSSNFRSIGDDSARMIGPMTQAEAGMRRWRDTAVPSLKQVGNAMAFSLHSSESLNKSVQSGSAIASTSARNALANRNAVTAFGRAAGPAAAQTALLGLAISGVSDKMRATNTTMGAMVGLSFGPWGAAVGAGVGLMLDLNAAAGGAADQINAIKQSIRAAGGNNLEAQKDAANRAYALAEQFAGKGGFSSIKDGIEGLFGKSETDELFEAADAIWQNYEDNKSAATEAALAEAGMAQSFMLASDAARQEAVSLMESKRAKNEIVDATLNAFNAETQYESALARAAEQGRQSNAGLDASTAAGRENRDVLGQVAAAWNQLADSGAASESDLEVARRKFVELAVAMGADRDLAEALSYELLHMPSANPKVKIGGIEQAYTQIADLKRYLKGIKDEDVYINVRRAIESGGGRGHQLKNSSNGNIFDFYANGGMRSENHVAQIAPAGSWRVWAEPETGGEAYIPLAESKRQRSLEIWAETGRRLGAQSFASGGFYGGSSGGPSHFTGDLYLSDDTFLGKIHGMATQVASDLIDRNNDRRTDSFRLQNRTAGR